MRQHCCTQLLYTAKLLYVRITSRVCTLDNIHKIPVACSMKHVAIKWTSGLLQQQCCMQQRCLVHGEVCITVNTAHIHTQLQRARVMGSMQLFMQPPTHRGTHDTHCGRALAPVCTRCPAWHGRASGSEQAGSHG